MDVLPLVVSVDKQMQIKNINQCNIRGEKNLMITRLTFCPVLTLVSEQNCHASVVEAVSIYFISPSLHPYKSRCLMGGA